MARAYVAGDLVVEGVHPGDPYDMIQALMGQLKLHVVARRGDPAAARTGLEHLKPPPPPPQEHLPRWRRTLEGLRHSKTP